MYFENSAWNGLSLLQRVLNQLQEFFTDRNTPAGAERVDPGNAHDEGEVDQKRAGALEMEIEDR